MTVREGKDGATVRVQLDADGKPTRVRDDGAPSLDVVELMHDILLNGATYETLIRRLGEPQAAETALDEIERFVHGMEPESPAEKLLAAQMLLQHAHIVQLLRRFSSQGIPTDVKALSGAVGAAMDVFRRQVEAWNRLRRPPLTVQAIQANLAYQQVIQGREGFDDAGPIRETRETPPAELPAESGGPRVPSAGHRANQAVGVQHRAPNPIGEGGELTKRAKARSVRG